MCPLPLRESFGTRKMITAKVIADSINKANGVRLVTLELEYPRYIHAEFMTHRVFSRNASSSRAIPVATMIDRVEQYPVFPSEWGTNKPGMQAGDPIGRMAQTEAENVWTLACRNAVNAARQLKDLGVHKQITNRILEPFSTIKVIVTATEWENFFDLRISLLAQPEIRALAIRMKAAMDASQPVVRSGDGEAGAHLPYVTDEERSTLSIGHLCRISTARCARVSYMNHDKSMPVIGKDIKFAGDLQADRHASPFEHPAFARADMHNEWSRNFLGWFQYREYVGL